MATDNIDKEMNATTGSPYSSGHLAASPEFQQDLERSVQLLVDEGNELGRRLSHVQQSAQSAGLGSAQRLAQLHKVVSIHQHRRVHILTQSQQAYIRLLWDSREVAGVTQGTVDGEIICWVISPRVGADSEQDFRTGMIVLIEDNDIDRDTKLEEIDGWVEVCRGLLLRYTSQLT